MLYERRLRLFIYARLVVTFLFLVSTIALYYSDSVAIKHQTYIGLVLLMAFSFVFSIVSHSFLHNQSYHLFISYLQTIWDLSFVTVLLLLTGGVSSPYPFLYLLSIMNAGVLLGRRDALYTASLCVILYGAIVDLQYFGYLESMGLSSYTAKQLGSSHLFYNIFVHMLGFYLAAVITGYLSETAKNNADELQKKNFNYLELERLSTSIVSNLDSGLMTVDATGNIQLFNRYAEAFTGKRQIEIFGEHVSAVLPMLSDIIINSNHPMSGEVEGLINTRNVTIWYSIIPLNAISGESNGWLVNFRDISEVKKLELTVKLKERLAVLGELSARMAHEIKNPLASMGGAVQLLAEHCPEGQHDKKLLTIILRESERLNSLISDFLSYARPALPVKQRIVLYELVNDIFMLLNADSRCEKVVMQNLVPQQFEILADSNQVKQVLFNIINNALDAMNATGQIVVDASKVNNDKSLDQQDEMIKITVADNGPGFAGEPLTHVFEPFWTTKPDGTGLGLAIVYRIMEGHGGGVSIENNISGGCKVSLWFPVC